MEAEDVREFDQTNTTKKTSRKGANAKFRKLKCWLDDDNEDETPYTSVKLPKNCILFT